jgi:hypothetical protein
MNRHLRRARRGYTLVFFAMFLFGFMALAALVIDVGFARLAQRQMQTAVDAAALEGLRFRDEVPEDIAKFIVESGGVPPPEANRDDPEWREYARRWLARHMVRATFEDYVDPKTGVWIQYGAGPTIDFEGGIGPAELAAAQTLVPESLGVWKPVLELNRANEKHGDLVAGEYDPEKEHWELPDYTRDDFKTPGDSGFLARLRRTNNFLGLDDIEGVSSHGPTIPFMFGRATAIGKIPGEIYSPREHGMTVRATAIADAKPVLSVGLPNRDVNPPLTGLVANEAMSFSFVLELDYWKGLSNEEATVTDEGEIQDDEGETKVVGRFYDLELIPESRKLLMPLVIGRSLRSPAVPPQVWFYGFQTPTGDFRPGYVPIYSNISDDPATTKDRVVGFGEVTAEVWTEADTEGDKTKVRFRRWSARIVPENASAAVCYPLRLDENELTSNELNTILNLNDKNKDAWILAPVSVR